MTFRLKITQVGKFPTSWSLTKLQDFGVHTLLSSRRSTLPSALTKTYNPISVDLIEKRRKKKPQVQGQPRSMTCFYCHQPGHMRRDCPQRKGSQSYGTAQSPSLVGQVWTQFVPSHLMQARGTSISLRVLHKRLRLHI